MASFEETALFEHRFWLQILGDHARFLYDLLSSKEHENGQIAYQYIAVFDNLLRIARQEVRGVELDLLTKTSYEQVQSFRRFKLHLLKQSILGKGVLRPTLPNHLINELNEYLRILHYFVQKQFPPLPPSVHHHTLWLLDAIGHSAFIGRTVDIVEREIISKSHAFQQHFEALFFQAVEVAGYLRTNLTSFPALTRFDNRAALEVLLFKKFLHELEDLGVEHSLFGAISPLVIDHMAREECYYLKKLAEVSSVQTTDCDPTHPRPS